MVCGHHGYGRHGHCCGRPCGAPFQLLLTWGVLLNVDVGMHYKRGAIDGEFKLPKVLWGEKYAPG